MILFPALLAASEQGSTVTSAYSVVTTHWLENKIPDFPNKCGLPALMHAQHTDAPAEVTAAASVMLQRPVTQTSVVVGQFRVHFDTSGPHEPAILNSQHIRIPGTAGRFADSVGAIANYALRFETDTLGYLPPPADNGSGGGPEYDIYIQESAGAFYGFTTPESPILPKPDGGTYTTFIVIDNDFTFVFPDSNKGLPALRVTLAHELHHAIQIGNYGFWQQDVYFYEMTSVWMEDVVFTEVNDYYQYLRSGQGHFQNPHVRFTASTFIMYSRGIWGNFVAKQYGRETMLQTWNAITLYRPLQAIDVALQQKGSGLRMAFGEWSLWNFYTGSRADTSRYYPEGTFYPHVREMAVGFSPPSRALVDSIPALSTRYHDVVGGQTALKLLTANINMPAALGGSGVYHPFTYLFNSNRIDQDYLPTASGIYVKFDVADRSHWISVLDTSSIQVTPPSPKTVAFPNPFIPDGTTTLKIPVGNFGSTQGTLSIYASSMDLVVSYSTLSVYTTALGQQVFSWDGRNDSRELAASGVYLYVLQLPDQTITGKFVLIRR